MKDAALEFDPMYLPHLLRVDAVISGDDFVKTAIAGHGQYSEQVG